MRSVDVTDEETRGDDSYRCSSMLYCLSDHANYFDRLDTGMRNWFAILVPLLFTGSLLFADEQKQRVEPPFPVQGHVVDETDQPIAGAEVEALDEVTMASSRTDDTGRFVLDIAHKPAVLLLRAHTPQTRQAFAAYLLDERSRYVLDRFLPRIELGLPDEIKLVARAPRKIEAVVVDGQKHPVADAKVFIYATWFQKIAEAQTDADGKAALLVPIDAPMSSIVAMKPGAGLDYFLYQTPAAERPDRVRLSPDHAGPLTFVLNGACRITVKVVDESGQPLADVKVSPFLLEKPRKGADREFVTNSFDGGAIHTGGLRDFTAISNADGLAKFDFLPADCLGGFSFLGGASDRMSFKSAFVEGGNEYGETTLTLFRTLPLRGRVAFSDGRPAAGAVIHVMQKPLDVGRDEGPPLGSVSAFADEHGEFVVGAFPNHVQWLSLLCKDKEWAAPLTTAVVLSDPPGPVEIVLQKATRVYGRLTAGANNQHLPNQHLSVLRHVEDVYRQVHDRGFKFKEEARPRRGFRANAAPVAPEDEPKLMFVPSSSSIMTDEDGRFEVPLGPGKYQLRYGEAVLDLELDGQAEQAANLHAERATHVEFAGRVVLQGAEQKSVANARVRAYFLLETRHFTPIDTKTNDKGVFHFARHPVDMLLYARDENSLFASVVRVPADDQTAIVTLRKAASAHGRLLDAATGEPLRNVRVCCGLSLDGRSALYDTSRGFQADERGEFAIAGLVPGQKYIITLHHNRQAGIQLATIEPPSAEVIDVGDYRVDSTGKVSRGASLR